MIAVDTSALVAIAFGEPEAKTFVAVLTQQDCIYGTPNALEAHIAAERRGSSRATGILHDPMRLSTLALLPFTAAQTFIAQQALACYGKDGDTLHPLTQAIIVNYASVISSNLL